MAARKAFWVKPPPAMIATFPESMGRMLYPYGRRVGALIKRGLGKASAATAMASRRVIGRMLYPYDSPESVQFDGSK
jgi:hypothetical protein